MASVMGPCDGEYDGCLGAAPPATQWECNEVCDGRCNRACEGGLVMRGDGLLTKRPSLKAQMQSHSSS